MPEKQYTVSVRDVLHNLGLLADAYEAISAGAGKPFLCDVAVAAANLKAAMQFIVQLPAWIPCGERLPDEGGVFPYVLAKIGGMFYPVIARRSETSSGWVELGDQRMFAAWEITHWMPLPEPPTDATEQT